jgi:hypothetical protein
LIFVTHKLVDDARPGCDILVRNNVCAFFVAIPVHGVDWDNVVKSEHGLRKRACIRGDDGNTTKVSFDRHNSPGFKPEGGDEKQFDVPPEFICIFACRANASEH